jgi:hypothetical protein
MLYVYLYEYIDLSSFRQLLKFSSTVNHLAIHFDHTLRKPTLDLVKHLRIHTGVSADWLELTQRIELLLQRLPNLRTFHNTSRSLVKQPEILWLISAIPTTALNSIHLRIGPADRDIFRIINLFPQLQSLTLVLFHSDFRGISEWVFDHQHALKLPGLQYFEWRCPLDLEPYFDNMFEFMALCLLGHGCKVSLNLGPHTTESHHQRIFWFLERNDIAAVHLQQANELLQTLFFMHSSSKMVRFEEIIIEPLSGLPSDRLLTRPIAANSLVLRCHLECKKNVGNIIEGWLDKLADNFRWDQNGRLQLRLELSFHRHPAERRSMNQLEADIKGPIIQTRLQRLRSQQRHVFLSYSIHDPGICGGRWIRL